MTDTASAAPSDAELFPLIEKHFGMVPRRDDTVIDRRNGRFHDAQRYRDFAADLLSARAQPTPPAVVEPRMPVGNATLEQLREWERDGELLERVWGTLVDQETEIGQLRAQPTPPAVAEPTQQPAPATQQAPQQEAQHLAQALTHNAGIKPRA